MFRIFFNSRFLLLKRHLADLKYRRQVCLLLEALYFFKIWLDALAARVFLCDAASTRLALDILKLCRINWRRYEGYRQLCGIEHFSEKSGLYRIGYNDNACARRIILLKECSSAGGRKEKGVLLVKFTDTFEFVIINFDTKSLLDDFYLVLEPSWSGYADQRILYWTRHPQHPVIVQASEPLDFEFIRRLSSNLLPVSFGASDWVDDRLFYPLPGVEKKYDAVYIAVYAPYKRHHVIFKALSQLDDKSTRIALVGVPWKGNRAEIELLILHYGLQGQVDFYENLNPSEVNLVLNQSKVNILLSLKEGSNKSIFEGLFAGTPAIVLKNNVGVNKQYINDETGMLIDESKLGAAIRHFQSNWRSYRTSEWAKLNISPARTTAKLEDVLKVLASANGEPWSKGLFVKVNSPEVGYYDDSPLCDLTEVLRTYVRRQQSQIILKDN